MRISHIVAVSCPDWVWWLRSNLLLAEKLKKELDVGLSLSQPHLSRIRLAPGWAKIDVNQRKLLFSFAVKKGMEKVRPIQMPSIERQKSILKQMLFSSGINT
jgi:hypothetical protein